MKKSGDSIGQIVNQSTCKKVVDSDQVANHANTYDSNVGENLAE